MALFFLRAFFLRDFLAMPISFLLVIVRVGTAAAPPGARAGGAGIRPDDASRACSAS